MRTIGLPEAAANGKLTVVEIQPGAAELALPTGAQLLTADVGRQGDDLLLEGADGVALVRDYFAQAQPPALTTAEGARLSADLVAKLAGPLAPGQVVQAGATPAGEPIGEVSQITGSAQVTRTNGVVEQLTLGDPVFLGDVVETGPNASVGIRFVDDTLFSLSSGARLVVDQLIYNPGGSDNALSLSLVTGAFAFVAGEIAPAPGEGMKIDTPVATIGIRGTTGAGQFDPALQQLLITLFEDFDGDVGQINVLLGNAAQSLSSVLDTIEVSVGDTTLPSPTSATPAQLATYANALSTLSRVYIDYLQDVNPEAGPEQDGGSGSSGGGFIEFIPDELGAIQFAEIGEGGEAQVVTITVDTEALADILEEDPNLILLLEAIAALDLPPTLTNVIDLDGNNSSEPVLPGGSGGGTGFELNFEEGAGPTAIVDEDISITSLSGTIEFASIGLVDPVDAANESLTIDESLLPPGITLDPSSTPSFLLLTGTASTEDYEAALQLVRYNNTDPGVDERDVVIELNDGIGPSNTAVTSIGFGQLVVGSNDDDEAESATEHQVPNAILADSGEIVSSDTSDVLIGDSGGSQAATINLVLAVDISGSMTVDDRLALTQQALANLLTIFEGTAQQGADVIVQIIPFNGQVRTEGNFNLADPDGLADAIAFINGLVADGGTNYQVALDRIADYLGGVGAGTSNSVYFLSDGDPALGDTDQGITDFNAFVAGFENLEVHSVGIDVDADALVLLSSFDNTGGAQNVQDPADLTAELASTVSPLPVGEDVLIGGSGSDIIFGDVINTDGLASAEFGAAGEHDGAGYDALVAFLTDNALAGTAAGEAPSDDQVADFIRSNPFQFIVAGDERGEADSVDGGAGDDTLFGMGGDDLLTGGQGNDLIFGGAGSDTFVLNLSEDSGSDVVSDFAGDVLRLNDVFDYDGSGVVDVADLDTALAASDGWSVVDNGTDVIVTLGSSDVRGQGGGQVVVEGIGDGTVNSFADLGAAISLEVNA